MKLYLDDIRECPLGFVLARSCGEAVAIIRSLRDLNEPFEAASLDHDLGACEKCTEQRKAIWEREGVMPNCEHIGTGVTMVHWMIRNRAWPLTKPTVHSMNPYGASVMRGLIDRYWQGPMHPKKAPPRPWREALTGAKDRPRVALFASTSTAKLRLGLKTEEDPRKRQAIYTELLRRKIMR